MKNFIFKSHGLIKNSSIPFELTIINKNLLYVTHQVDKILKIVTVLKLDKELQTQVNDYFQQDIQTDIPQEEK